MLSGRLNEEPGNQKKARDWSYLHAGRQIMEQDPENSGIGLHRARRMSREKQEAGDRDGQGLWTEKRMREGEDSLRRRRSVSNTNGYHLNWKLKIDFWM